MPITELKTINAPEYLEGIISLISLFIPLPICKYEADFVIKGWGFGSMISVTKYKIPLGLIMVVAAIIF